jgi:hypothetical protein
MVKDASVMINSISIEARREVQHFDMARKV